MTGICRDERTIATENASYRWAFHFMCYGLLLSTMYRGLVYSEAAWDLLALVIVGGGVATVYQARYRVLSREWAIASAVAFAVGVFVAVAVALGLLLR